MTIKIRNKTLRSHKFVVYIENITEVELGENTLEFVKFGQGWITFPLPSELQAIIFNNLVPNKEDTVVANPTIEVLNKILKIKTTPCECTK